jgi:hypothetical protein
VLDGLLHNVLEHGQIDVVELLDVEAAFAGHVLAKLRENPTRPPPQIFGSVFVTRFIMSRTA